MYVKPAESVQTDFGHTVGPLKLLFISSDQGQEIQVQHPTASVAEVFRSVCSKSEGNSIYLLVGYPSVLLL